MAASLGEAVLYLLGDKTKLDETVSEAQRSTQKTMDNIGKGMQKAGGIMTAAVTAPLVGLGFAALNAASDFEESLNKVRVVFGDAAGSVEEFASSAAENLGMSEQQALSAAGTFGNLFVALGLGTGPAADMSQNVLTLASDLASFNNMDPTEVLDKLRAGIIGETEPLRALGVNLNAAAIEAKALELGLVPLTVDANKLTKAQLKLKAATADLAKQTRIYGEESDEALAANVAYSEATLALEDALAGQQGELTAAMKAQASYALITEQTATAHGDFLNTSDGVANSTRILKGQLADMSAEMGSHLLPYAQQAVLAMRNLASRFGELSPETQKNILLFAGVAAAIGPLLVVIGTLITTISGLIPVVTAVAGALTFPLIAIILAVVAAVVLLYLAWQNNFGGIRDTLTAFFNNTIVPTFEALKEWLAEELPKALEWLKDTWETVLWPAIQKVRDWFVNVLFPSLQKMWDWLATNIPEAIKKVSDFWTNTLLPAIKTVHTWWSTTMLPFLEAFAEFVNAVLSLAITALTKTWELVLLPALKSVWEFLDANVFPIIKQIAEFFSGEFTKATDAIAKTWEETLLPALKSVAKFLSENVWPVVEQVGLFIRDVFVAAIQGLTDAFRILADWIQKVNDKLKNFKPPPVTYPHSPTPFETGIRGISDAMDQLATKSLTGLIGSLGDLGNADVLSTVAGLELGDGGDRVTNNFDLSATFPAESPVSLIEKVKMLRLLGVS